MTRSAATAAAFVSAIAFPWPATVALALGVALFEPLVPLAVGIFVDALRYSGGWPLATIAGALATAAAYLVRSWLKASIIGA
jgi:hypothetical protein